MTRPQVVALGAGVLVASLLHAPAGVAAPAQPLAARHVLHRATLGAWHVEIRAPTTAVGLHDGVLTATTRGRVVEVPLDGTPTGRRALAVDAILLHAPSQRLLVLTDRTQDAPGLIVVDLAAERVVVSLVGRDLTVSPDFRFVAFEQYFSRLDTPWPWNETVYAVLDVTHPEEAALGACPYGDDRCRGVAVHLPHRADVCADYRHRSDSATCLHPGRRPQHERRSPFVWLDRHTLAFVSVDHARAEAVGVTATFDSSTRPAIRRHSCDPTPDRRGARCPPTRTPWQVDHIRRDDDDGQLWVHFRDRLPEVPGGWLALAPAPSTP